MSSPIASSWRRLKTPGSAMALSTCPVITALPSNPGTVPCLYHPASTKFVGAAMLPCVLTPTSWMCASMSSFETRSRAGRSSGSATRGSISMSATDTSVSGVYHSCSAVAAKMRAPHISPTITMRVGVLLRVLPPFLRYLPRFFKVADNFLVRYLRERCIPLADGAEVRRRFKDDDFVALRLKFADRVGSANRRGKDDLRVRIARASRTQRSLGCFSGRHAIVHHNDDLRLCGACVRAAFIFLDASFHLARLIAHNIFDIHPCVDNTNAAGSDSSDGILWVPGRAYFARNDRV